MIKLKKIFCLNIIFFITFFTMGMNKFENKQIYKNITIENINVGGMKYKQALDEINKLYKVKLITYWNILSDISDNLPKFRYSR